MPTKHRRPAPILPGLTDDQLDEVRAWVQALHDEALGGVTACRLAAEASSADYAVSNMKHWQSVCAAYRLALDRLERALRRRARDRKGA